jgi:hypothetical protein
VLAANLAVAAVDCGLSETTCAERGAPVRWEGRVFDAGGRPAAAVVTLAFPALPDGDDPVRVRTDAAGRFCVRWPEEHRDVRVAVPELSGHGPPDPRFGGRSPDAGPQRALIVAPGVGLQSDDALLYDGFYGSVWRPREDALPACPRAEATPAWYDAEGAGSNWRVRVVYALGAVALALALVALAAGRGRRGRRLFVAAAASSAVSVLAWALTWGPVIA